MKAQFLLYSYFTAQNDSFRNSSWWPIYFINSVNKTKRSYNSLKQQVPLTQQAFHKWEFLRPTNQLLCCVLCSELFLEQDILGYHKESKSWKKKKLRHMKYCITITITITSMYQNSGCRHLRHAVGYSKSQYPFLFTWRIL